MNGVGLPLWGLGFKVEGLGFGALGVRGQRLVLGGYFWGYCGVRWETLVFWQCLS